MLAYIGYLSLEDRLVPQSARQYVSAVSKYDEDSSFVSPNKTRLLSNLMVATSKRQIGEGRKRKNE